METFEYFLQKRGINHDEAFNLVIGRFANLVIDADLATISQVQFKTLCVLLNGIHTLDDVNGKSTLVSAVDFALSRQSDFRNEIVGVKFADDTPETRTHFMAKLDVEREYLCDLLKTVKTLTDAQAIALLERVEEVLYAPGEVNEDKCEMVYEKMQARSQL